MTREEILQELRKYALEMEEKHGVPAVILVSLALAENPALDPNAVGSFGEVGIFQITDSMLRDIQRHFGITGDRRDLRQATELAALGWKICQRYANYYNIPPSAENLLSIWNAGIGRTLDLRAKFLMTGGDPNIDYGWLLPATRGLLSRFLQATLIEIELRNSGKY